MMMTIKMMNKMKIKSGSAIYGEDAEFYENHYKARGVKYHFEQYKGQPYNVLRSTVKAASITPGVRALA
ncbi:hypothetical protein FCM35_KLT01290 [Carex littledalei]|uniref:Uncharacterized protein n=1 Tax=Carex littledalei TaxID=544730 RepID=A0A833VTX5_9POAL|nr:hypothetical protein FCM35_KLT01290 [Carex littledalei]